MKIRTAICIVAILPLQAQAAKGDFSFKIDDKVEVIPSSCVESVSYNPKDQFYSENISFSLTSACGKHLNQVTRQNIGKIATFSYRDNVISSALIAQTLGANFMISSKDSPRTVLMQILNDYGVAHE